VPHHECHEHQLDGGEDEVVRARPALEDLREVIGVLRTDRDGAGHAPERPQPTLADLPALVDQSRRAGMRVLLDCQVAEPTAAPDAVGRNTYRIVQEGLTNAHKHAHDTNEHVLRALRAGASGFLLKHTPPADILRAIFRVSEGEPIL
jgi:hypothetical protein